MGRKIKYLLAIVFFPIVIIFCLIKIIIRKIKSACVLKYINNIGIEKIDTLDGVEFENFLITIFETMGFNVKKTKRSHDYGADIILSFKDTIIAIQCKLYYNHSVSNSAVQEIASAMQYYKANHAMVITNSTFTRPAQNLATSVGVKLVDKTNLFNIITNKNAFIKFLQ